MTGIFLTSIEVLDKQTLIVCTQFGKIIRINNIQYIFKAGRQMPAPYSSSFNLDSLEYIVNGSCSEPAFNSLVAVYKFKQKQNDHQGFLETKTQE